MLSIALWAMPGNCSVSQNLQHSPPGPHFPLQPFTSTPPWPVRPGLLRSARLPGRCLFGFPLQSLSQAVAASAETFPGRETGNQKPRHWPKTPGVNLLPTKKSLKIPAPLSQPLRLSGIHTTHLKKPPEIPQNPTGFPHAHPHKNKFPKFPFLQLPSEPLRGYPPQKTSKIPKNLLDFFLHCCIMEIESIVSILRHKPAQAGTSRHKPAQAGTSRHKPAQAGTSRHKPAQESGQSPDYGISSTLNSQGAYSL